MSCSDDDGTDLMTSKPKETLYLDEGMSEEAYNKIISEIDAPVMDGAYQTGPKGVKEDYKRAKAIMEIRVRISNYRYFLCYYL